MNTIKKQYYITPVVECIKIDNDIALQLESGPPTGPGEDIGLNNQEYFTNNPFLAENA